MFIILTNNNIDDQSCYRTTTDYLSTDIKYFHSIVNTEKEYIDIEHSLFTNFKLNKDIVNESCIWVQIFDTEQNKMIYKRIDYYIFDPNYDKSKYVLFKRSGWYRDVASYKTNESGDKYYDKYYISPAVGYSN